MEEDGESTFLSKRDDIHQHILLPLNTSQASGNLSSSSTIESLAPIFPQLQRRPTQLTFYSSKYGHQKPLELPSRGPKAPTSVRAPSSFKRDWTEPQSVTVVDLSRWALEQQKKKKKKKKACYEMGSEGILSPMRKRWLLQGLLSLLAWTYCVADKC